MDLLTVQPVDAMARLVLTSGDGRELSFQLEGRARAFLGRGEGCDLILADGRVSRRHASISSVAGHHLLRDEGSSNGTFLNGLRLKPGDAFLLREGDAIEVGDQRLIYACGAHVSEVSSEPRLLAHSLADLVAEGYADLDLVERRELQVSVQRAFEGVPRLFGLERSLAIVRRRLDVHAAALFLEDASHQLRLVAGLPSLEATRPLGALARSAFGRKEGLLHRATSASAATHLDLDGDARESAAAVPLLGKDGLRGAIVIERTGGRAVAKQDLAALAVLADRVLQILSLQGKKAGDTLPGCAA